jgi:aspartyl-tRNA(Asn)/glutamyl-tRNA(Gln) amidotransferase subunit A
MIQRSASPIEVVQSCLDRIERFNPGINAFITVLSVEARRAAEEAVAEIEAGRCRGPLHGMPVATKDFYDTAGIRTTAAFEHFKDRVPKSDAESVTRLKEAGAIIVGKTNMHRLGMGTTGTESAFGPVRNPWNVDYIAGGSSSGSAAAVASGFCHATLDTDAIGSCRLPAACCGVVGFKGTYGLLSSKGILAGERDPGEMIRWFGHPAITSRRVNDTAIVLDALTNASYAEEMAGAMDLRVGVANNFQADREVAEAFEAAVAQIRGLGYSTVSVAAPLQHPLEDLSTIEADRRSIGDELFREIDVLLLPTTATTVPTMEEASRNPQALSAANTMFANYYGLPAISVPSGFDRRGLPLGLQMVGRPWGEASLLHLASRYEKATLPAAREPFAG